MALFSRVLSRSRQIPVTQIVVQHEHQPLVCFYATKAAAPGGRRPYKGDEMLKNIFYDVKNKFETALAIFRKERIIIDPEDPAAVKHYADVIKTVREKAGLLNESQKFKFTIEQRTQGIPDARTYLMTLKDVRIKSGIFDNFGAENMMMEALDKVEKQIKKPLLRSDKKNMALLHAEFAEIRKKLGIRKEDLPKMEEDLEMKMAKADLEIMKRNVTEAIETQLKRLRKDDPPVNEEELKQNMAKADLETLKRSVDYHLKRLEYPEEEMVDIKTLDTRNFL